MKYIFLILLLTIPFAQELQVEGDLTVSGDINSAVIDSLQAEIENLQNLLSEYSGVIKTRVIELEVSLNLNENNDMIMVVPLNELVGNTNIWYKIIPLYNDINVNSCGEDIVVDANYSEDVNQNNNISYGHYRYRFDTGLSSATVLPIFVYGPSPTLFLFGDLNASNCSGTITLLVTSEN